MEIYVLKSVACLGICFAFYKIALENSSLHVLKRFYLLGSLLLSLSIPLITFTRYVEATTSGAVGSNAIMTVEAFQETINLYSYLPSVLWTIYIGGVLFFGLKFVINLRRMIRKIRLNPKLRNQNIFHVLLKQDRSPHTFLNYIFFHKSSYETKKIPNEVILHERAHAEQWHSLDVLLLEFIKIFFWFNPVLPFFNRSIRLNHEFLADDAVLNRGFETSEYQNILLAYSSHAVAPNLANSINYSLIKKRFTVMKTKTSLFSRNLRLLLLLPLFSILLYSFSSVEILPKETEETLHQEGATAKQIKEYNALAKKYNAVNIKDRVIKLKDLKRLEIIYKLMTPAQKASAEPFPECIPPPPPPPPDPDDVNSKSGNKVVPPPPPPPPAPDAVGSDDPPPPPPPPNPIEHLTQLAKEGASFFLEGKSITSKEAIRLLKNREDLNISVKKKNGDKVTVNLTKAPITIKD